MYFIIIFIWGLFLAQKVDRRERGSDTQQRLPKVLRQRSGPVFYYLILVNPGTPILGTSLLAIIFENVENGHEG